MNKIKFYYIKAFFLISSLLFSNQLNINYQFKYAGGLGSSRNYFENYFDFNYFFSNGLYLYSQLEFSNPPLIGRNESLKYVGGFLVPLPTINTLYLQYSGANYDLTIGDLNLLYGRGLSIHTYEDHAIDYDNTLLGLESSVNIKENIDLFIFIGKNKVNSRINPGNQYADLSIDNKIISIGSNLYYKDIGIHYLTMVYQQEFDYIDIFNMMNLSSELGDYLSSRQNYIIANKPDYDMNNIEHNLGFDFSVASIDLYFERSIIYYSKILGERVSGYRQYSSAYFNLYDTDFFIEYKNYNVPYLYSVFSNPPIGFRESSSILSSRNLHSIDFSNEYGYQLEIIKRLDDSMNFLASYAFGIHHNEDLNDITIDRREYFPFSSFLSLNKFSGFEPFKQFYVEVNGWNLNEKFYYKFGYEKYYEITQLKSIYAITTPMQFAYKFKKGNSLTLYLEFQDKKEMTTSSDQEFIYFSPSYSHFGKWVLTLFFDHEKSKKTWRGMDYTININNSSRISLFYGSQKGGLVCANGSCVQQPDFEKGLKVTFSTAL